MSACAVLSGEEGTRPADLNTAFMSAVEHLLPLLVNHRRNHFCDTHPGDPSWDCLDCSRQICSFRQCSSLFGPRNGCILASSGQGIDEENTDLGGPKAPVDIDEAGGRRVRRYVSDYAKVCNTYYGRRICYRIYETGRLSLALAASRN